MPDTPDQTTTTNPCDEPERVRPPTDWSGALHALAADVIGTIESGPSLTILIDTVQWMRDNPTQARILIGDLTTGY